MKTRKWPVVGVLLSVLWLFVRGVELAPRPVLGEWLIGLAVGLPVAYGSRRLYLAEVDVGRNLRALPQGTLYVSLFLWELLTANVDVAYRVLHPSLPIEPDVVELPLRVETDAAITTIANSITLTPGTLTMDHDADTNTLYVHGIVGRRRKAVVAPIRRWEDLLLVMFDEAASPGDVPPEPQHQRPRWREAVEQAGSDGGVEAEPVRGSDGSATAGGGSGGQGEAGGGSGGQGEAGGGSGEQVDADRGGDADGR